jgi:hypothetical protein
MISALNYELSFLSAVNELEHGVFDNINDNLKYVHDMNWHSISYRESPDVLVAISWFYQVHTFFNKGFFSVYYCIVIIIMWIFFQVLCITAPLCCYLFLAH